MKIDRAAVYEKYDGHCAYCGRKIEYKDMQVDHMIPQVTFYEKVEIGDVNDMSNLMPACRQCNHYKRANSIEIFRKMISEIPKKLDRDSYIYRVGEIYGFYDSRPKDVTFYYEAAEYEGDV